MGRLMMGRQSMRRLVAGHQVIGRQAVRLLVTGHQVTGRLGMKRRVVRVTYLGMRSSRLRWCRTGRSGTRSCRASAGTASAIHDRIAKSPRSLDSYIMVRSQVDTQTILQGTSFPI